MWSNRLLAKICALGSFGGVGVLIFVHGEIQGRIRQSTCYIEAFKHLHENKEAVQYFGEPLKAGYVNNIYDTDDQSDSVYWYKVPIKGPNAKGTLYYKLVKEEKWILSRVELELEKLPGKRLLMMENNGTTEGEPIQRDFTEQDFTGEDFNKKYLSGKDLTEEIKGLNIY